MYGESGTLRAIPLYSTASFYEEDALQGGGNNQTAGRRNVLLRGNYRDNETSARF